jgi:hypothetical protein
MRGREHRKENDGGLIILKYIMSIYEDSMMKTTKPVKSRRGKGMEKKEQ